MNAVRGAFADTGAIHARPASLWPEGTVRVEVRMDTISVGLAVPRQKKTSSCSNGNGIHKASHLKNEMDPIFEKVYIIGHLASDYECIPA